MLQKRCCSTLLLFYSRYLGYDIRISGRKGFNALINGIWLQKGQQDGRPYFTKGSLFLYFNGTKWRIVKEMGSDVSHAYVLLDSDDALNYQTPDGSTDWKIWNAKEHIADPHVRVERSYG